MFNQMSRYLLQILYKAYLNISRSHLWCSQAIILFRMDLTFLHMVLLPSLRHFKTKWLLIGTLVHHKTTRLCFLSSTIWIQEERLDKWLHSRLILFQEECNIRALSLACKTQISNPIFQLKLIQILCHINLLKWFQQNICKIRMLTWLRFKTLLRKHLQKEKRYGVQLERSRLRWSPLRIS